MTADPRDAALYANHRRFLEAQRGALTRHDGYDAVHGDTPDFQIALLHEAAALADAARAGAFVFVPPWAQVEPGARELAGLAYRLTHMSLPAGALAPAPLADGVSIEIVRDEAQLRAFTGVQAAAFAPNAEALQPLHDWMLEKNLGAYRLSDQHYYVLNHEGRAASVLLSVDYGDTLGLYAVATRPEQQKQGLSSQLLAHVCAPAARAKQICLQTLRGSAAERLYGKVGFVERFVVDVYASAIRLPAA